MPIWNDFFFPLVLITSDNLKTLPLWLTVFVGEFTTDWVVLFTGLTLAALPITLLYRAVEAVHFRHHARRGQIGAVQQRSQDIESGEPEQDHHHLRGHRLDPHAVNVAASAGDGGRDRDRRHRGGRGRCRDRPSSRPQSGRRTPRPVNRGLRAFPAGHQAALQLRRQHHHGGRRDDERGGTRQAGEGVRA
ncbi:hypothetical protein MPLSOD_140086 [Mesorhizobium sp. SOD10]|nr:hypothetical protein MPLSOD_140086 [Mesorhizobium sp. SOD10]